MKIAKTEPITVRIPTETKRILRDVCETRKIDLAEYIRQLIDRDLTAMDAIPPREKRFIERVVEQQTQQMLDYITREIGKKIDRIYYNTGTGYDKARCRAEELYAYMKMKYNEINQACSEGRDEKIKQYINEFATGKNEEETFQNIKNAIDTEIMSKEKEAKAR